MWIRSRGEETILSCRVHPNAPRNRIEKVQDDQLVVRLNSPPVEGKANKALIKLLAKTLHLAPSRLSIQAPSQLHPWEITARSGFSPSRVQAREKSGRWEMRGTNPLR